MAQSDSSETGALAVNGERLWGRLMELAKIGATDKGGVCRLTLTDLDKEGRDLFCQWAREAGCTIDIDAMGNIFVRREGSDPDAPPVAAGSHLDSQPTGGKFDGALGVLAALEVIDSLNDHQIETRAPVEAVAWTNEEGARFTPAMIGSGVYAGEFELDYAYGRTDKDGKTFGDELERIGYKGTTACGEHRIGAHFEMHIEQGPILESAGIDVGIVTGVQGIRWYNLIITGAETHAGPTPMHSRSDPVQLMAELIPQIYAIVTSAGEDARCTIGIIETSPGSTNTVPGEVRTSLDVRHPNAEVLARVHEELMSLVGKVDTGSPSATLEPYWYSPPVAFHTDCIDAIAGAADQCAPEAMRIVSGAGHDSVYTSMVVPTGMIFIPCKDGLSHNELEDTRPEQAALGASVLLNAVLQLAGRADAQ